MLYNKEVNNKHNSVILRIEWDENEWMRSNQTPYQTKNCRKKSDEIF